MTRDAHHPPSRHPETGTGLWRVILPLVIWAGHFLTCYIIAAIYCEKVGRAAELTPVTIAVWGVTALAIAGIGAVALGLWRVRGRSLTGGDFDYENNAREERHRFLSHVGLMVCLLATVAVIYGALPTLYLGSCR